MRLDPTSTLLRCTVAAVFAVPLLSGQTLIDLRAQSRNVDHSLAPFTRPVKSGYSLPATCAIGEAFLLLSATPGEGLNWCTALNTWTKQTPNAVQKEVPTTWGVGARQTFRAGTAAGFRLQPGILPGTGLAGDLAVDALDNTLKIHDGTQWASISGGGGGTGDEVVPGLGVSISGTEPKQISVDSAVVPAFLHYSTLIDFPEIGGGMCEEGNIAAAGAAVGDAVAPGWPALAPGLIGIMQVTSANTVAVRLCNVTLGVIDPPNDTFRATLLRSF